MIDSYSYSSIRQDLKFNSVSGTIIKTHPKSIICKTGENPFLLDMDNPRKRRDDRHGVIILQVMVLKDGFVVEYVNEEDWNVGLE